MTETISLSWRVENVCFGACDQESAVVDHVLCAWAHSSRLMMMMMMMMMNEWTLTWH